MAKNSSGYIYFCNECGYESSKWLGQCPACKAWNSLVEEKVDKKAVSSAGKASGSLRGETASPVTFDNISLKEEGRISIGIGELDRVLGGGIVRGSLILVGGDPGIGKSTLLLQACKHLSDAGHEVLYISGEESLKQIKLRAIRIGEFGEHVKVLCETSLGEIGRVVGKNAPEVMVIDSIQTMQSDDIDSTPGSVSQVREATSVLMRLAKEKGIAVFVVGHVTKEGTVAGPRVLEHMVDTVLYFEGDRHASYRILRGVKNRFGSTNDMGVFEMKKEGLIEVKNPSEYMLSGRPVNVSGSVVSCSMEGSRPLLIEIQALVSRTSFGYPKRQTAGSDLNRLNLLMAVLEKRLEMKIADYDAYINIAGGIKISEPAIDLGIVLAIVSSFRNRAISDDTVVFGEVGLSGEIRPVNAPAQRVQEALKLGFKRVVMPASNLEAASEIKGIEIVGVSSISEALDKI
ncbi:MAG: DNA repair protein RadA [Lachnospiraceae bacterium]|nr:DNA repair protein RadA [Lachnospiraceae bacterium]